MCRELSADPDPLTADVSIVSSSDGYGQMPDEQLGSEEIDVMDSSNASHLIAKPELRRGKFQPKPKMHMHKGAFEANEPMPCSPGPQCVQPETNYSQMNPILVFQQDDMPDLSDLGFTQKLPTEATSEHPINFLREGPVSYKETDKLDWGVHLDGEPEIPASLASPHMASRQTNTRRKTHIPSPQHQPVSMSCDHETSRILRRRKSKINLCELVDEEVLASGDISDPPPEEENDVAEEIQLENDRITNKKG